MIWRVMSRAQNLLSLLQRSNVTLHCDCKRGGTKTRGTICLQNEKCCFLATTKKLRGRFMFMSTTSSQLNQDHWTVCRLGLVIPLKKLKGKPEAEGRAVRIPYQQETAQKVRGTHHKPDMKHSYPCSFLWSNVISIIMPHLSQDEESLLPK